MAVLRDWELDLTADQVLRAQGADPAAIRARKPALAGIAEWALREGLPLLEPAVLYREITTGKLRHERLSLAAGGSLSGRLIAQHLGGAGRVIALLATIGPGLEEIAGELMRTDPLLGWALDALGSAAVEALSLAACNYFEAQAQRAGAQTTLPLSPGMVGWPAIQGQAQIFALLDGGEIGVSLTANSLMLPRKTLSMVVGVGAQVTRGGRSCDYCSLSETCQYQNHYLVHQGTIQGGAQAAPGG